MADGPKENLGEDAKAAPAPAPAPRPAEVPQAAPARAAEGDRAAEDLAGTPEILLPREMKYIDDRFNEARKAVARIYDSIPKAIADTESADFKEKILEKVLEYALFDVRRWWKDEVRAMIDSGADATKVINLREKYFVPDDKEGKSLMGKSIQLADLYLHKLIENSGALTGNDLLKMLDSKSQKAAIYVDLLKSDQYKDVVEALTGVLDRSQKGVEEAMPIIEKRLRTEFPAGKCMKPLWMIIAFLPEKNRIDIANKYKKQNPGQIMVFLEEGNKMGVFSPDEMQQVLGKPLDESKKSLYAKLWNDQHQHNEAVARMGRSSYGSRNPVNEKMTLAGTLGFLGKAAAYGTIVGNLVVTGSVHMKGKGILGGIGAIPKAVVETTKVAAVKVAAAGLGLAHYWKKSNEHPEGKIPREKEEFQGLAALNNVKKGSGFWDRFHAFFNIGDFEGGRAFAGFLDSVQKEHKAFGDEDEGPLSAKKLTAAKFIAYLDEQSKKSEPDDKLNYARLKGAFTDRLSKSSDDTVKLLADAFYKLKIGGDTGKSTYSNALDELPKLSA